ncbi:MAG: hypothetical protein K6F20_04340 [Bacteroidaceae bacterium]|nr:hypothetical protein [Bacteroidaceae bacterium]
MKISADYSALAAKVNATFTADLFGDGPVKANPALKRRAELSGSALCILTVVRKGCWG